MFKRTGSVLTLLAAISLLPLTPADAGDRRERHRIHKHHGIELNDRSVHNGHRHGHRRFQRRAVTIVKVNLGRKRHHRHRHGVNTYSGDVVVHSTQGVGTWSYGTASAIEAVIVTAPTAKIIDVGTLKPNSACEMQAGVCVIKP